MESHIHYKVDAILGLNVHRKVQSRRVGEKRGDDPKITGCTLRHKSFGVLGILPIACPYGTAPRCIILRIRVKRNLRVGLPDVCSQGRGKARGLIQNCRCTSIHPSSFRGTQYDAEFLHSNYQKSSPCPLPPASSPPAPPLVPPQSSFGARGKLRRHAGRRKEGSRR